MRITFADVQRNITDIANREEYTTDILFELMAAYGRSASSITKLRNGVINVSEDKENSILQRGVVYFKFIKDYKSLPAEVEKLEKDSLTVRYNPRFIIATDLKKFAAKDLKKGNSLEIEWKDIDRHVDFFFGWTGDEITDEKTEALADRRAADKMQELYQEIEIVNKKSLTDKKNNFRHNLNVFFTRLLFCFFAEDTKVFSKDNTSIFTSAIKDYTLIDGSDLDIFLETLFEALDEKDKSKYTSPYSNFPYVNGKLFDKNFGVVIPKFNAQARKLILDCGSLNWAEINPDIFGSMFQSIVDEEMRSTHGMHYTSVPNIMKTIEPLFLDELRDSFDKNYDNKIKLKKLYDRISKIKIFDPACGSGNFLIIAYKELRKLEHAIIDRLIDKDYEREIFAGRLTSRIDLNSFYGIEIDDFACEVATLSLYLAKHQMNIEFEKQFGKRIELIPLTDRANIVHGNAARIDWQNVCPNLPHTSDVLSGKQEMLIPNDSEQMQLAMEDEKWDEIYLIGNPPYAGFLYQSKSQKEDMDYVFSAHTNKRKLDYVSIWFIKGCNFIKRSNARLSFVATNSICQGEQVALLWPEIINQNIEIGYAYNSFKWQNSAKDNAGVTCVIVSLRNRSSQPKFLFNHNLRQPVKYINAYLADADDIYITNRRIPISDLPPSTLGSSPYENGHLLLSSSERSHLIDKYPDIKILIRKFVGSQEFIRSEEKYCLWIEDRDADLAFSVPEIKDRLEKVKIFRLRSKRGKTKETASTPYKFTEPRHVNSPSIIVPIVSSERRSYMVLGLMDGNCIIPNSARAIYNADTWLFSILSAKMHIVWVKAVAGRLETRIRYSANVYNSFPIRILSDTEKVELGRSARNILYTRENYSERKLSDLYDPDIMPNDLREAHHKNDILVDSLYRQKPYESDEERLSDLFKLYEEMTKEENNE